MLLKTPLNLKNTKFIKSNSTVSRITMLIANGIASLIAVGVLQGTKKEVYEMISEMGIDLLSKLNTDIDLQKTLSNITLPKGDA